MLCETSIGTFTVVEPSLRAWRLMLESLSAADRRLVGQAVMRLVAVQDVNDDAQVMAAWDDAMGMLVDLAARVPDLAAYLAMGSLAETASGKRTLSREAALEMTGSDIAALVEALQNCGFLKAFRDRAKNWLSRVAANAPGA